MAWGIHKISKTNTYVRYLQENPSEIEIIFKELLIGVTGFFRDTAVWEHLTDTFFTNMFAELQDQNILRTWVPECSTCEEAYSFVIIFKKQLKKQNLIKS
jgi:two-component system CheB/CheR fusion protein